ncbi:hypothetical protein [Sulfurimonas sp.]
MIKKFELLNKSVENQDVALLKAEASRIYSDLIETDLIDLHLFEYEYNPDQAVEELGLDEELINELVEDYVSQIIKSLVQFETKLQTLQESKNNEISLDYSPFRELAHKNLGVARNLRIKNAEILLYELMKKEDLQYLILCLDALEVASIKLNPQRAYNTLKLIQAKKLFNI